MLICKKNYCRLFKKKFPASGVLPTPGFQLLLASLDISGVLLCDSSTWISSSSCYDFLFLINFVLLASLLFLLLASLPAAASSSSAPAFSGVHSNAWVIRLTENGQITEDDLPGPGQFQLMTSRNSLCPG